MMEDSYSVELKATVTIPVAKGDEIMEIKYGCIVEKANSAFDVSVIATERVFSHISRAQVPDISMNVTHIDVIPTHER